MNYFNIWLAVGWSVFGLIVIGCAVLAYLLWNDSKKRASRNVAAPMLVPRDADGSMFQSSGRAKKAAPSSRKERRQQKSTLETESTDSSSLWSDDDDFEILNGKD